MVTYGRITLGRAGLRYLVETISGLLVGIGYLLGGITAKKQTLHGLVVGTLVVRAEAAGDVHDGD